RRHAERDLSPVRLPTVLDEAQQARRAPEPDDEHAGRVGIERAGVTDAALPVRLAQAGHDVVRRPAFALVDDDRAVDDHVVTGSAASMRATTSSMPSV